MRPYLIAGPYSHQPWVMIKNGKGQHRYLPVGRDGRNHARSTPLITGEFSRQDASLSVWLLEAPGCSAGQVSKERENLLSYQPSSIIHDNALHWVQCEATCAWAAGLNKTTQIFMLCQGTCARATL